VSEGAAQKKTSDPLIVGRYALFDELASGGMATVHLGRMLVTSGEGRTVAVKRLHAQYTKDAEFCTMFLDEARLVLRIKHPNCVRTVDVVQDERGLFLVMEYVHGESLSRLMRTARERREPIPPKLLATLMHGVLLGLHAAHEVVGDDGKLLGVVHRDVSPQNVIVGSDGTAKVLDFGIAKAAGRMQQTREGQIKGKLAYMAPEQIRGQVDRRTDVFAASVVLWEALAGRRLHEGLKDVEIVTRVVQGKFGPPSAHSPGISPELDAIVLKGLAPDPKKRYLTAKEMATDLEKKVGLVPREEIGRWVEKLAKGILDKRMAKVKAIEEAARGLRPSEGAIALPRPLTPDSFKPVSAVESTGPKSEREVAEELDAVATTTPPTAPNKAAPNEPKPPTPAPANALRVATPASPITPAVKAPPPPPVITDATPAVAPEANDPDTGSHTGTSQITPSGTSLPFVVLPDNAVPAPPPRHPLLIPIFVASLVLALAGAALGGYAIAKRGEPAPAPTSTSPTITTPTVTAPTVTAPTLTVPSATTTVTAPTATHAIPPPSAKIAEPVVPEATAEPSASTSATSTATTTAKPREREKPKPTCDPPYTVDANGNKNFKPECMGL